MRDEHELGVSVDKATACNDNLARKVLNGGGTSMRSRTEA